MLRVPLGLHLILAASVFIAAEISGIVTEVHDCDTLTLVNWQYTYRIRLVDIGAPEIAQPRGQDAQINLAHLFALKRASRLDPRELWADDAPMPPWASA